MYEDAATRPTVRVTPRKTYKLATLGSRTERGGQVAVVHDKIHEADGHLVACVGDTVRYPDGSEARIVTGVPKILVNDRPLAVEGSTLDNGDVIVQSLQDGIEINEYDDDEPLIVACGMPA